MTKKPPRLFILDGHGLIYAAYYAPMRPLNAPNGEPTKAVYVFTTMLLGLLEREKPDMVVMVMESLTPTFRTKMYPEYKAHRPPMPEDMPGQIARIEQILEAMRIPVLRVDGYEADDVIGTLAVQAARQGVQVYICSKDKDMLQLIGPSIFIYDIKTGKKTDLKTLKAETGLVPEQFVDVLALQGDTADNVPGVPDVGPKTALEWIKKYGSLDTLYAHADEIKGKRGQNLRASREMVQLSRQLVTIHCDAPIQFDPSSFRVSEPDKEKLAAVFSELGFTRLLTQMGLKDEGLSESDSAVKSGSAGRKGQGVLFEDGQASPAKRLANKSYHLVDTPEKLDAFVNELKKQNKFAFDTETTHIDAMRADLVGLSFSWQADVGWYLPVRAPLGQDRLELESVKAVIGPILTDAKRYKIAQNLKYDWLVLENAGMPIAVSDGRVFDTMVASYCLSPDRGSHSMDAMSRDYLGYEPKTISSLIGKGKSQRTFDRVDTQAACDYSAEDADVTWQLYEYLARRLEAQPALKKLFETVEMPLVEVLARMEANGVSLDTALLRQMSNELSDMIQDLTEKIYTLAGGPFNLDSPKQLAEILFDRLGLESVKSGKTLRSTDAGVLEQLADRHEIIPLILQYRQLVKLKNTYIDKLPKLVNPRTGRVHASFNQTVTATGRLSSSDPNLQNIPARTELGRRIRAAFVPGDKNGCILSADYSQIELRLLAHFSRDEALLKAFAEDRDIHSFVASQIYGVPIEEVTPQMRSKAKAVNFGIIYGQGPYGLARSVGIGQQEARRFIEDYFARYKSIRAFMDEVIAKAAKRGYAETILGRRRPITGLNSRNHNVRSQAERMAVNTVIQGSAADLIKVAMINIHRRIKSEHPEVKMILQIHDELVFELPKAQAARHAEWIKQEMTGAMALRVPLKVDISIGPTWMED
jgi:DNA polymerase-1